jgi:hypothetical protein
VTTYDYTGAQAKEASLITGQEAIICEVEQVCSQLNKLKDLQLDELFFVRWLWKYERT